MADIQKDMDVAQLHTQPWQHIQDSNEIELVRVVGYDDPKVNPGYQMQEDWVNSMEILSME